MDILYSDKGIILHQLNYELELLKRFELTNYKTTITRAEMNHKLDSDVVGDDVNAPNFKILVGSLRYLRNTRPDICYEVGIMSRFMNKLTWSQYQVVVRTLKYGVLFPSGVKSESELMCYSDYFFVWRHN